MKSLYLALIVSMPVAAMAGTFETIKDPSCIGAAQAPGSFSAGEQYRDSNNGILLDKWFMLSRWQADESDFVSNSVAYNIGAWTGLTAPYQRGVNPESSAGSPGVQLSCYDSGMLINTWGTPHRPVVGGGYNDMIGYAFSTSQRPTPFIKNSFPTDLVLQADVAVPLWNKWNNTHPSPGQNYGIAGQVGLYAYLKDLSNPSYPPIVVAAMTHMTNLLDTAAPPGTGVGQREHYRYRGLVSYDYSGAMTNAARTGAQSYWFTSTPANGSGIWFVSAPISSMNDQRYVTRNYSVGDLLADQSTVYNTSTPLTFWRAHITRTNMQNIVTDINAEAVAAVAAGCSTCPPAPPSGYSTNPNNWVLEYAGVISEVTLASPQYDASRTSWGGDPAGPTPYNDTSKDQAVIGVHVYAPGIYRYYP